MYLINLSVFNILKANKMEIFFTFKIQEKEKIQTNNARSGKEIWTYHEGDLNGRRYCMLIM